MGKKMTGKKGQEKEKHKGREPDDTLKEVSYRKSEVPMRIEDETIFCNENREQKESSHEVSGNGVELKATHSEAAVEGEIHVEKKKKKKRHEISRDDVEVSASENGVVMKGDDDGDKKKKKNKKKREVDGSNIGIISSRAEAVIESNVKDKRRRQNKNLQHVSGNDVEFNANRSESIIDRDVHVDKKKKKRKRHEVSVNDFEFSANQHDAFVDMHNNENEKDNKEKKKKKKKRKAELVINGQMNSEEQDIPEMMNGDEGYQKKKKKHCKRSKDGGLTETNNVTNGKDKREKEQLDEKIMEKVDNSRKKKKKRKKKHHNDDLQGGKLGNVDSGAKGRDIVENESSRHSSINDAGENLEGHADGEEDSKREKKKEAKSVESPSEGDKKTLPSNKKGVSSESPTERGRSKKVSFSDQVEVFPSTDGESTEDDGLVHGKRFSKEEDEMIKRAVISYIEAHRLGEEGLNMVLHCRSHPEVKNCWKEIGAALPWRPSESVYYRAHVLFERDENRKWNPEELELVREFHERHGSDWKMLAEALGKHRFHVKDAWRRIRLPNLKKGQWSQEEYQKLFDLVNTDLLLKASEEKKSKHGMLRDNISWEAISEKLETRSNALCCMKWYDQLTSPMVAEGKWSDTDDYHLVNALSSFDACCMDDVDWDNLLEHRPGSICRKRWNQMVKHIGSNGTKSFAEQVEILSTRYSLDVLEARVAYSSKPAVK